MRIVLPFTFVIWDLRTSAAKDKNPVMPWSLPHVQELFYGTDDDGVDHMESCPVDGLLNLPRDCGDFKGLFKDDTAFEKFQEYLRELQQVVLTAKKDEDIAKMTVSAREPGDKEGGGKEKGAAKEGETSGKRGRTADKYKDEKKIVQTWFNRVWSRGDANNKVDKVLKDEECLPSQVYSRLGQGWPPKKVCFAFLYTLLLINGS